MNTVFLISTFVTCVIFLIIGIVIGRSLSKWMLLSLEKELKSQFDAEKQQQQSTIQSLNQELALSRQEYKQLDQSSSLIKEELQQHRVFLENIKNDNTQLSSKLSASISTEQGLTVRLQERDNSIAHLNQTISHLSAEKTSQQELIEQQKVLLGQAQEQQQQLELLRNEQQRKEQHLQTAIDELTKAHAHIAELKMANHKDEQLIAERNQTIHQMQVDYDALLVQHEQHNQTIKQQKELLGQAKAEKEQLAQLQEQLKRKDESIKGLQTEATAYISTIEQLKTAAESDARNMEEKLALLESNKAQLKEEFENLAHKIFENKQQQFKTASTDSLNGLLNPFQKELADFRKRVEEVHTNNVAGQATIKTELEKLRELNGRINDEAANLTKALKTDKKLQGSWGEQKVDLLLQRSGLRKDIEYSKEENFKNDEGNNQRPDFVVKLPEGKHIIIDSKMSLVAYMDYVAADNDEARQEALNRHIKAIEQHITALSARKYHTLQGLNTPDFVFLFMPIESAYILLSEHAPAIFEKAYEKNIAIVTAANLLPVLRVVANLWSIQRQNQTTKELADQAGRVYDKLCVFIHKMEDIGKHINKAQESYHDSFNTLKDGKGSLTKIVSNFVDLGVKVSKQLPASVLLEDLP
ncbi:MAG: DNA recombination protein RmuC [Moraxellaceae bacterium]|nr:DNA recombination protein RmuC [Moraxellaceae bacterium]